MKICSFSSKYVSAERTGLTRVTLSYVIRMRSVRSKLLCEVTAKALSKAILDAVATVLQEVLASKPGETCWVRLGLCVFETRSTWVYAVGEYSACNGGRGRAMWNVFTPANQLYAVMKKLRLSRRFLPALAVHSMHCTALGMALLSIPGRTAVPHSRASC